MQTVVQMGNSCVRAGGRIRPFAEEDLPSIVDLYLRIFPQARQYSRARLRARFNRVLLQNPWYDASMPSLVYQKDDTVHGFLGVVVRPMLLGADVIRMAVGNHFMVEPGARLTLAGLELLREFFAGPQDLSIAEAGDACQRLWEALGGRTSLIRSLYWTRLLRPARYCLYHLERRALPLPLVWICGALCRAADSLAVRIRHSPVRQVSQAPEEELSEGTFLACLETFPKITALRPQYDEYSLNWLLTLLKQKQMLGRLCKVVVRDCQREIIGWYIYYPNPGGVSTVVQMAAAPGCFDQVFQHICHYAWRRGSIALTGRLEPRFTKDLRDNQCVLHWRSWMLAHSRHSNILEAVDSKDAFLTPMEGEFWIRVEGEMTDNVRSSQAR